MLEIIAELPPALSRRSPIAKRNWKPMKARKFGYDVAHARLLTRVHRRTGRGARGAAPPPPPKFGQLRCFWAAREIWAKPVFKYVSMFFIIIIIIIIIILKR